MGSGFSVSLASSMLNRNRVPSTLVSSTPHWACQALGYQMLLLHGAQETSDLAADLTFEKEREEVAGLDKEIPVLTKPVSMQ